MRMKRVLDAARAERPAPRRNPARSKGQLESPPAETSRRRRPQCRYAMGEVPAFMEELAEREGQCPPCPSDS